MAPSTALVNQDGDADGRWAIMTFIFTRCPAPEYCPLMNRNFVVIQDGLEPSLAEKARLLSVTLDPEFDTSERLKAYGDACGADFSNWEFATGSTDRDYVPPAG